MPVSRTLAFAPDGQTLASGSYDSTIKLWRVSDGACLQTFTGHTTVEYGRGLRAGWADAGHRQ